MTRASEISFAYKPRLGPVAAICAIIVFVAVGGIIGWYGLFSINRGMRLYGISFSPAVARTVFILCAVLYVYLAFKMLLVTIRSHGTPRFISLSTRYISSPQSSISGKNIKVKFSDITGIQINNSGNVTVLEIYYPGGIIKIPKTMIESDESFASLAGLVQERSTNTLAKN